MTFVLKASKMNFSIGLHLTSIMSTTTLNQGSNPKEKHNPQALQWRKIKGQVQSTNSIIVPNQFFRNN
jgi:hypothetical protein